MMFFQTRRKFSVNNFVQANDLISLSWKSFTQSLKTVHNHCNVQYPRNKIQIRWLIILIGLKQPILPKKISHINKILVTFVRTTRIVCNDQPKNNVCYHSKKCSEQ